MTGTVIGAKVFSREGAEPDSRSSAIQEQEAAKLEKTRKIELLSLKTRLFVKL